MKLTKKLLTVLPMITIGSITPIVVSGCSCSSSYSINYGDSIDCKNKDAKNYHSIDQVKETSKNHVEVFPQQSMAKEKLLAWNTTNQQKFYWDLIYSLSKNNIGFTLTWNLNDTKTECSGFNYNGADYTSLEYDFNTSGAVEIKTNTGTTIVASHMYYLVTKA